MIENRWKIIILWYSFINIRYRYKVLRNVEPCSKWRCVIVDNL